MCYIFIYINKIPTIFILTRQGTKVDKKRGEVKPFVCIYDFITKSKIPNDKAINNNLKPKVFFSLFTKKNLN